jgi:hypothetical protein
VAETQIEPPIEPSYPDFLIRCTSHAGASPLGSIEAKYRWEGVEWLPASVRGKHNVVVSTLRGTELDDWWSVAVDDDDTSVPSELRRPKDAPPLREHHEICCSSKTCRNRIPTPKETLQWVFMVTTLALRESSKPDRQQWIYDLPRLVAAVDTNRRVVTYTFDGLRAALTYSKAKWGRHGRR